VGSPKSRTALERLGHDIRGARLRRGMAVAELAVRAGTSESTIARLEHGDSGVRIGALADVLVALGLVERLADLIDIRKDDLGLALTSEHVPRRGKTFAAQLLRQQQNRTGSEDERDALDPDGVAF